MQIEREYDKWKYHLSKVWGGQTLGERILHNILLIEQETNRDVLQVWLDSNSLIWNIIGKQKGKEINYSHLNQLAKLISRNLCNVE